MDRISWRTRRSPFHTGVPLWPAFIMVSALIFTPFSALCGTPHHKDAILMPAWLYNILSHKELNYGLQEAVARGDLSAIQSFLQQGGDVNAKWASGFVTDGPPRDPFDGATLLIAAAAMGHVDSVRLLLDKGADVKARNDLGETALIVAAQIPNIDLRHYPDVNARKKAAEEMLRSAGHLIDVDDAARVMTLLLDRGADVNAQDKEGSTSLLHTALMGRAPLVKLLLARGASANARSAGGSTPLMLAAAELFVQRQKEATDAEAKARIAAEDRDFVNIVNLLLEHGADVNAGSKDWTALDIAIRFRSTSIIKVLKKAAGKK